MAGAFGGFGDDEDDVLAPKEPQVTSQDPEERKAGRALRIKRRQEALKRAEQLSEVTFKEEEPGPIEQATSSAAEELQRLALDGTAKVTNVKVTTDEREVIRRTLFSDKMLASLAKIEEEAADAQIQYDAITANWDIMLEIKDPLDIDAAIKEQRIKCQELLEQKDNLIAELKQDLNRMDVGYYEDLEKQDKDIKELSDRIEKQITIMQRAYEKQLFLIEQAINIEREVMVDHNNKRWEALYKQRDKEEVAHLEFKFEQLEEHKLEIEAIMWDHHAKYREAKIELETLIQELQKELEKLKATCIINTEKIGYNYQVLKKREEENVFVRSQQKRKLNKMSDVANTLRSKIRKAAEDGAIEEIKANAEIVSLMQAMEDLEKKCRHFSHVNNYKFSQVWRMCGSRCAGLARRVRSAETALHAHVLAEPPPPPPPPPPKSPLSKYENEIPVKDIAALQSKEVGDPKNMATAEAKDRLVRHILQLVADNTGFLVEDRLLKLIEKYPLTSRNLCTLDSIFMALEIQAEEDIELMCKIFLNYAFCPICIGMEEHTSDMMEHSTTGIESQDDTHRVSVCAKGERSSSTRARSSVVRSISASTSRSVHVGFRGAESLSSTDQLLIAEADAILQKCGDPKVSTCPSESASEAGGSARRRGVTVSQTPALVTTRTNNPFLCPVGHYLEIESMQVLTALNEFMSVFVPPEKRKLYNILDSVQPPDFTTPSRKLTAQEIDQYWSQWKNQFPPEKDRFWDGLLSGLNNYLSILQERERIHNEVSQLRARNTALRRLVRGALPDLPARPAPSRAFTAPVPDLAPPPYKLPPI
ncbi:unnamed protein product [Danaus chrysippus]|uniref:(African queen) hypothetical protein n=1 Tax=Danaus chrysippus TaxID=151541 RepID=A0A8J2VTJ1_9NEOP|nr:unnamed protein product [Danaus chrysippus]